MSDPLDFSDQQDDTPASRAAYRESSGTSRQVLIGLGAFGACAFLLGVLALVVVFVKWDKNQGGQPDVKKDQPARNATVPLKVFIAERPEGAWILSGDVEISDFFQPGLDSIRHELVSLYFQQYGEAGATTWCYADKKKTKGIDKLMVALRDGTKHRAALELQYVEGVLLVGRVVSVE